MRKRGVLAIVIFAVIVAVGLAVFLPRGSEPRLENTDVLVEGLDTPWAIGFLPDGRMIFTERPGRVRVWSKGSLRTVAVLDVDERSESGLLGIAVDPDFEKNRFVYVYYTHSLANRLSRFMLNDLLEDEQVLLDGIPRAIFHDGGRIAFGPDGKLYVTTGDATIPSSAQDLDSLAGKILRLNKDGTVPEDNPFGNYVYSYGHRNPQGIAWHPDTGELYAAEHGPVRNDEVNIIVRGGNYGWPLDCTSQAEGVIQPVRCFTEFTLAPAGITFVGNNLFVAGLRGAQVRKLSLGNGIVREEEFMTGIGRVREVVAHEGFIYIATSNRDGRGLPRSGDDRIIKVRP